MWIEASIQVFRICFRQRFTRAENQTYQGLKYKGLKIWSSKFQAGACKSNQSLEGCCPDMYEFSQGNTQIKSSFFHALFFNLGLFSGSPLDFFVHLGVCVSGTSKNLSKSLRIVQSPVIVFISYLLNGLQLPDLYGILG